MKCPQDDEQTTIRVHANTTRMNSQAQQVSNIDEFVVLFQISEIQDCKHIHDLFLLRDLNLLGNPVQVT